MESNQPAEYFLSCNQLTLDRFIRALVDSDLSALIICGAPTHAELSEAWANIYFEYIDINQDNESIYIRNLEKDVNLLSEEISEVETCLYFLSPQLLPFTDDTQRGQLLDIINDFVNVTLDFSSPDYVKQLKRLDNRLASKRLEYRRKKKELEEYLRDKVDQSIDRNYFNRMLTRLGRHNNTYLEEHKITVARFVLMIKQYFEEISKRNERMEGVKNGK